MNTKRNEYHIVEGFLDVKKIQLEIQRYALSLNIDLDNFLGNVEVSHFQDQFARKMVVDLMAKVASKKYDVKTVRFPENWFESFKNEYFPGWALKKWPVKFTEVTMEATAYYPDIQIPDKQTFVEVLIQCRKAGY